MGTKRQKMETTKRYQCALCHRDVNEVTKHHLIPRTRHKNRKNKKTFSRTEVKERVILVCQPCHSNIHAVLTEKELERTYNTLEKLAKHPKVERFSQWLSRKPEGVSVTRKRKKKRGG
jgi:hypothetical protein